MNHAARIDALRARMAEADLPALVVSRGSSVRYLTGYVGSNGVAVIGHEDAVLLTDTRYAVSARDQVSAARVEIARQDLVGGVAAAALEVAGEGPVGVEADVVTLSWHERLLAGLDGRTTRATTGMVDALRLRKDAEEIAEIRRAASIADAALQRVLGAGIVGRSEMEVAHDLQSAVVDLGAEGLSFAAIVAAADRGARPHAVPSRTPIPPDTLVVVDMGALLESGYMSDMTRTVATGPLPEAMARIHDICLDAQRAALGAVRPGTTAGAVDAVARGRIGKAG
ncbi:MAG: Xaa-Pro peptidase family protein, partial [Miltoncostaeaceae bacterium]